MYENEKRYLLIGDSLGYGKEGIPGRGWAYYFAQVVGAGNCTISVHTDFGFTRLQIGDTEVINTEYVDYVGSYPNGFLYLLRDAVAYDQSITDVIVLGGLNDCYSNASGEIISEAVQNFYDEAIQRCPNATVWLGMLGSCSCDWADSTIRRIRDVVLPVMKSKSTYSSTNTKCRYIRNCEYLCRKYWLYSNTQNDTIHLTDAYYSEIGSQLANEFRTGIVINGVKKMPSFVYDNSLFASVDNAPIQTGGVSLKDGITTFYGVKSCCFWPISNSTLHANWNDNVTSVHLGNIDTNTYYTGVGDNIIPVTGFIGFIREQEPSVERFYNFTGFLNLFARHVNLDIEIVRYINGNVIETVGMEGCISRICFMYPTVCVSSLLG